MRDLLEDIAAIISVGMMIAFILTICAATAPIPA